MSDEFDVAFFSEMYPASLHSCTTSPQLLHQIQASAIVEDEPKQRRRRRRKKKASETNVSSSKKRKLSEGQAEMLEKSFGFDRKLESERKDRLAAEVGLDPKQVAVWFQNRRARWKSKKMEDDYSKLRSQHDALLLHNCRLHTQLAELKEDLNEAQKEVQKADVIRTTTPSSSLTMDTNTAVDPPPLLQMHAGDFNFHGAAFHFQDQDAFYNVPAFGFDLWTME